MFGIFAPKYVKEARDLLKNAQKLFCYKKDIWSGTTVDSFETQMKKLSDAIDRRDEKAVEVESAALDDMAGKFAPPPADVSIRENCEVLLVAIIIALGVRSYFLQPFAIPTGSMQPTLNGIIGHRTNTPAPNILVRAGEALVTGRSYVDVVCEEGGTIPYEIQGEPEKMVEFQRFHFFTYTSFQCGSKTYTVPMPKGTLQQYFGVIPGKEYSKGETILHGYIDAGDHVFVDKFTYNFRLPSRGDVFVFNTAGIPTGEKQNNPEAPSQFYIKRLGGLPGDQLRIDPPILYQNGEKATAPGYVRVMSCKDGYRGYSQGPPGGYLSSPDSPFRIPSKCYFALGDNSYNSSDSRYWGTVPQRNIVGKGLFVFWPFIPHWGSIQ